MTSGGAQGEELRATEGPHCERGVLPEWTSCPWCWPGRFRGNGRPPVAIHDPCLFGRGLKVSEGPRQLLTALGLKYADVRNCGEFASCCGGPAESVSPALNREILERRVAELKAGGGPVVTFCPICLANLLKALAEMLDEFGRTGFAGFVEEWLARNAHAGARVSILAEGADPIEGRCAGVDSDGALLLDTAAGLRRIVSGEVSLRPR